MHRVSPRFRVNALVTQPRSGLGQSSCAHTAACWANCSERCPPPPTRPPRWKIPPIGITNRRLDWPPKRLRASKPVSVGARSCLPARKSVRPKLRGRPWATAFHQLTAPRPVWSYISWEACLHIMR